MKPFLDADFLLQSASARRLYHDFAADQPIIDYHNHLSPQLIAEYHRFANLTEAWLDGDHYKWRAMRTHGVNERYCTGDATPEEKFAQWAETVPYTLQNPLFHWTHLELQRYFGIHELLSPKTAITTYQSATERLQLPEFSVRNLLLKMNVRVLCTTDDPIDSLVFHKQIANDAFGIKVLPGFRPDNALAVDTPAFLGYVQSLEKAADMAITRFDHYLDALKSRHDYFAAHGCRVSDHGLEQLYAEPYTDAEVAAIFEKALKQISLSTQEVLQFKSALLYYFALWDWEKGWVQQFHLGPMRNNNARMLASLGKDTGWDSIGDFPQGRSLSRFLDRLDTENHLTKTIIYNLNPRDNALFATMAGNFNDGSSAAKVQWGAAWWFMDQQHGMEEHLRVLSSMGLVSHFVGMLTDSRSFLSFPRHEYFRRLLCNFLGNDMENGLLPNDPAWIGKVVKDICYENAKGYFGF